MDNNPQYHDPALGQAGVDVHRGAVLAFVIFGFRTRIAILTTLSYICETCGWRRLTRVAADVHGSAWVFHPGFPLGPGRYTDT